MQTSEYLHGVVQEVLCRAGLVVLPVEVGQGVG